MIYGYARVSTDGQSEAAQVRQLRAAGAKKVFREVASGAKTDRAQIRPKLCRVSDTGPLMIYPPVVMAGVRKPSGKEPAGAGLAVCYLWGFAGAASWVGAALAVVMGDGPTIGFGILSPRRPLAGCFWHDRGRRTRPGRPPVNSAAMPEARFPGRWVVR